MIAFINKVHRYVIISVCFVAAAECGWLYVEHSDQDGDTNGTTYESIWVECDAGYSGSGNATCTPDMDEHTNTSSWNFTGCWANPCESTQVANSDYTATGSINGSTDDMLNITCDDGFYGSGTIICEANGTFSSVECTGS